MRRFSKLNFLRKCFAKTHISQQVRWSSKRRPAWFQYRRPTEPHELAKEFFDGLYSKRFRKDWPSIRCALLSRKKYAAIMNNFYESDETEQDFIASGAVDIVQLMRKNAKDMCKAISRDIEDLTEEMGRGNDRVNQSGVSPEMVNLDPVKNHDKRGEMGQHKRIMEDGESLEITNSDPVGNHDDASRGSSDLMLQERLDWLIDRYETYEKLSKACNDLRVYAYSKGDLKEFDDPMEEKKSSSILQYFLLDGSSILPILALNPEPDDHMFDTCAAPGGKLMCMMQLCEDGSGTIVANDVSSSRSNRVRKVLNEYIPKDSSMRKRMKVITMDVADWDTIETSVYDKVLVDVPCTADRHSLFPTFEQRDNIFSQLRKRERANLPRLQSEILKNAILSCRPGGSIVYSTCTASLQQNEYVIQMTIQHLLENNGVSCEIEDLTPLTHLLKDHFYFFKETELGILALPFLNANYGPTYVCKIVRMR